MLYFIILASIICLLFFLWYIFNLIKKKEKNKKDIKINFEDVDSLNVSKIVIQENDIDFIRNDFWYQYKQKKKLNRVNFNALKKHFEKENNLKISESKNSEDLLKLDNLALINIIISDSEDKNQIASAFHLIEQKILSN